jgi:hypothetical protein
MYPNLHPPPYPSAPVDSDEETKVQPHEEGFEVVEKEAKKSIYPEGMFEIDFFKLNF